MIIATRSPGKLTSTLRLMQRSKIAQGGDSSKGERRDGKPTLPLPLGTDTLPSGGSDRDAAECSPTAYDSDENQGTERPKINFPLSRSWKGCGNIGHDLCYLWDEKLLAPYSSVCDVVSPIVVSSDSAVVVEAFVYQNFDFRHEMHIINASLGPGFPYASFRPRHSGCSVAYNNARRLVDG